MNDYKNIKAIAHYYVKTLGLPIIPLCSSDHQGMPDSHKQQCKCPGKMPILKEWTRRGVPTVAETDRWFQSNPNINIGLLLGEASEWNLVGVDIDGTSGEILLKQWSNGVVPVTWEFTTSNGRRLLYRLPTDMQSKKAKITGENGELALCCTGQQTVFAPSQHASGKQYSWLEGRGPLDIQIAYAPLWIVNRICQLDKYAVEGDEAQEAQALQVIQQQHQPTVVEDEWLQQVDSGGRSNHLTKLCGSLIAKSLPKNAVIAMLDGWNKAYCKPPLLPHELEAMVESIWLAEEAQKAKKEEKRQNKLVSGSKQLLQPITLAREFIQKQLTLGIHWKYSENRQTFYYCSDFVGPWLSCECLFLEQRIRPFLIDQDITWGKSTQLNEVMRALKEALAERETDDIFDMGKHGDQNTVVLRNGLLDWKTGIMRPWTPECHSTMQLPVDWNPESIGCAGHKMWLDALKEWLPDKGTREFLQEFVGYCLIPATGLRTAVFLYGEGCNGKSLFLEIMAMLFGSYVNNTSLQRLADKFETSRLTDKLVNICGDVDSTYLAETALLKAIIAGDTINGEAKFKNAFTFTPFCRLIFSANTLPRTSDKSQGWYNRWKFIEFPHQFEVNPNYKTSLINTMRRGDSLSALLAWAVEGLQRVMGRGAFTHSHTMEQAKREYQCYDDSAVGFLHECFTISQIELPAEYMVSAKAVFQVYIKWCKENGLKAQNNLAFGKRLGAQKVTTTRRPIKGVTTQCYDNLIPKTDISIEGMEVKIAINMEQIHMSQ